MNAIAPAFGCATGGMPFEDALERVLSLVSAPLAVESIPLTFCAGRVLADSFAARLNLPGFDQSAMDGYAVCSADITAGMALPVTGRTAAGEAPGHLVFGGAHRILTGAPLPHGADAVIAQENVYRDGDVVHIERAPPAGTNVRRRGEDIRAGENLIGEGTILDWRQLTVMAAQGTGSVFLRRRPRVALLSSGRELRGLGEILAPGQIHDSNMPMLVALLSAWGAEVQPASVVADDALSMQAALRDAAEHADLVLTTAGISVGDEDHVRDALQALGGDLAVLKVAMKPGKPLAAGRLGDAVFVGLPGNPMAALAGTVGFVQPLLARMAGTPAARPRRAYAGFDMRRKAGRAEFIAVRLVQQDACLWAERTGPDGSGRLAPLLTADTFVFLPAGTGDVGQGDRLQVVPFLPCAIKPGVEADCG
jgi:molybdopterin molybdotransferase